MVRIVDWATVLGIGAGWNVLGAGCVTTFVGEKK